MFLGVLLIHFLTISPLINPSTVGFPYKNDGDHPTMLPEWLLGWLPGWLPKGPRAPRAPAAAAAEDMLRLPNFQAMLGPTLGSIAFHAAQLRNRVFAYGVEEVHGRGVVVRMAMGAITKGGRSDGCWGCAGAVNDGYLLYNDAWGSNVKSWLV